MHGRIDKVIEGGGRETGREGILDPRLLVAYWIASEDITPAWACDLLPAVPLLWLGPIKMSGVWCLVLCKSWTICAIKFSHANRPSLPSAAPRHTASSALVCSLKIVGDLLDFASCPDTGCCCCWSLAWHQLPCTDGSIMALSGCSLFTPELLIAVKCPHLTGTVSPGGAAAGRSEDDHAFNEWIGWRWEQSNIKKIVYLDIIHLISNLTLHLLHNMSVFIQDIYLTHLDSWWPAACRNVMQCLPSQQSVASRVWRVAGLVLALLAAGHKSWRDEARS